MKIGISTGGTSVRSKKIFTDISRYPTGKHEIKLDNLVEGFILEQEKYNLMTVFLYFIFIFRYPFYMLSTIEYEISWITWLRYTAWIPLYPLGILFEGICVFVFVFQMNLYLSQM